MGTTISGFNKPYASVSAYDAARDSLVEELENPKLLNGVTGAGVYGFGQPYTIGYGYDISRQTGTNLVGDLNAALSDVGGLAHFLTQAQINQIASYGTPGGASLASVNNIFSSDFNGGALTLSQSQAGALLDAIAPRYEASLENYLTSNVADQTVASNLGTARVLLFSEWYNGGSAVVGASQTEALFTDDFGKLVADLLTANTVANGQHILGLENRSLSELYFYLGLPIPTFPTGNNVTYSPIQVQDPATAAALLQAINANASMMQANIVEIASNNQSLAISVQNLINNTQASLDAMLGAADIGVTRAGETIDAFAARVGADPNMVRALNPLFADGEPTAGQVLVFASGGQPISAGVYDVNGVYATSYAFAVNVANGTISLVGVDPSNPRSLAGSVYVMNGDQVIGAFSPGTVDTPTINASNGNIDVSVGGGNTLEYANDGSATLSGNGSVFDLPAGSFVTINQGGASVIYSNGSVSTMWQNAGVQQISFESSYGSSNYGNYLMSTLGLQEDQPVSEVTYTAPDASGVTRTYQQIDLQTPSGNGDTLTLEEPTSGGAPGTVTVTQNYGNASLTVSYAVDPSGALGSIVVTGDVSNAVAPTQTQLSAAETAVNQTVGLDAASGTPDNSRLSDLVVNLGSLTLGQLPATEDPTGSVPDSQILVTGDASITVPDVNNNGLLDTSIGDIVSAEYRPGNQMLEPDQSDLDVLLPDASGATQSDTGLTLTPDLPFINLDPDSNSFTNIDPLVLDLTGNGISLSNWISNDVYFQSNVVFDPTTGKAESDGALHHTSWVNAGNGILVLPVNGQVTNITETLSEYFEGGQFNAATGQYTPWTDGLAALASLATPGATVFSAATSLTDPATGQSYWSELRVWQDTNQDGVAQPSELESLDTLGITAIGLVGSGNQGEQIDGNAITNTTTYTTSAGTTDEVAAVDLQTDTTGDLSATASGGIIVTSTPEGGPAPTNTFVAQNATGHTYVVNDGTLTDQTTGTVVNSGTIPITGIFSTTQNDTITVNATDTGTYWLDGGSGADTLTGGAGTTVFLINPQTVVHGGSGFNIAYVNSAQPANIDLKTDNLEEVIGGSGGGVFNASGANWNVFIQATAGNNIIIGGTAVDALSGGSGDDIIEGGPGGSVIHAGTGNDVIYSGSGTNAQGQPNSDIIYAGPGQDTVVLGTNNAEVYDGSGSLTVVGNANGFSVVGFHGSYADYTLTHNADGSITVTNINDEDGDGTVTMTNVTALDFNNIEQVKIANAAGMPVNDQLSIGNPAQVTTSGNSYVIAAATLLANDIDYSGKTLSIRALIDNNGDLIARGGSGVVNGGVASLSTDGSAITFTPTPGFSGVYSFRYYVVDSSGNDGLTVSQIGTTNTAEMSATVYLNPPSAPSDPLYDSEWFLQAANVPTVWQDYTGAGVSVGIFDPSGNVDFSNPDLAPNAGAEVMIDGQPGQQQVGTHATLIAGIIGAADDGAGAVGVAPGATLDSEAIGSPTNATGEATGIDDSNLMDWSKYDVVNNSFQVTPPFSAQYLSGSSGPSDLTALQNAVQNGRDGLGTIVIFGGGNSRASGQTTNDFTETNSPYEITVGGIDAPSDLGALQISGAPFSDPG
ncbi:MAG TPA: Ig-like domain-containing protein, partial [Acetobacteraceae bacterium]|nr:Ig-like domain-containing protein [Acetobacteraceae bacterium]